MIRVMLADDHPLVRGGVAQLLRDAGGMQVVAEASDYASVMRGLRDHAVDVLVLDVDMPGKNGIEIARLAKKEVPRLAILVYSMHPESEYGPRALKSGASGYLSKSAPPAELLQAVRTLAEGRKYVNADLAQALAERMSEPEDERPPHEKLSDREFETLKLIASGKRLADIAVIMALSPKTVSVYRARLLEKMRMSNNAELTHYALKNKLVD